MSITQLQPKQLYNKCTLVKIPAIMKNPPEALTDVIGQEAAEKALLFAMKMKADGYNAFCIGPRGIGKKNLALQLLKKHAATLPTPDDICFVRTLQNPNQALLLSLPAGKGPVFIKHMRSALDVLAHTLPESLYDSRYLSGLQAIKDELKRRQGAYLEKLQQLVKGKKYVRIAPFESGYCVLPVYHGKTVQPDAFNKLPPKVQKVAYAQMVQARALLTEALNIEPCPTDDEEQTFAFATRYFTAQVKKAFHTISYADTSVFVEEIVKFCTPVLLAENEDVSDKQKECKTLLQHYQFSLVSTHPSKSGAPVVFLETSTSTAQLFGRAESTTRGTNLEWRFVGGALHQANGGFLVCRAADLTDAALTQLIDALKTHKLSTDVSNVPALLDVPTLALNLKVVLLGDANEYNKLCAKHPDFLYFFKVSVPFALTVDRTSQNVVQYASLLRLLARKYKLKPLTKAALERLVELAGRLAENQQQLTARLSAMTALMKEANYWAKSSRELDAEHIDMALQAENERDNVMKEQLLQRIRSQQLLLSVEGKEIGQVNILYTAEGSNFRYGRPARTTCSTHIGTGVIADVETQSQLGGSSYAKGITILQAFLASQFGQTEPLCVDASVVLEQSYAHIDGDSASCAQLCALLSAIGQIPLAQNIALTGSVNQLGHVQSVGSVNAKIEGFFDVCYGLGLTGTQGVIIPTANTEQLMLRADVVKAIKTGKFYVWTVDNVYEAMTLLTGKTEAYIKRCVRQRLHQYYVDSHKKPKKS